MSEEYEPAVKRFRHESYASTLKTVHLPSAASQTHLDDQLEDSQSHFYAALSLNRQVNLDPNFVKFANAVDSWSQSLPLLIVNVDKIIDCWVGATGQCKDQGDGIKALLDLLAKLIFDLRSYVVPFFERLFDGLLPLLELQLTPEAFNTLFSCLSNLFKYSCPSFATLADTVYAKYADALRSCNPEVQRGGGEVWSSVIRRAKADERELVVATLLKNLHSGDGAFEAWAIVAACKGVSQGLHSSTPSLVGSLLHYHLTSEDHLEEMSTLLRRIITALTHHTSSPESFEPVTSTLVNLIKNCAVSATDSDTKREKLARMIRVLDVATSVRKGSRFSTTQLTSVLDTLSRLPLSSDVLRLSVAILTSVPMTSPSSTALSFLNKVFSTLSSSTQAAEQLLCLQFTRSLSELQYSQFVSMVRPIFLKHVGVYLVSEDLEVVLECCDLLGHMIQAGHMEMDKEKLPDISACIERVEQVQDLETQAVGLACLTKVPRLLSKDRFARYLHKTIVAALGLCEDSKSDPKEDFREKWFNAGWRIGTALRSLSNQTYALTEDEIGRIIVRWGWSAFVMEAAQLYCQKSKIILPSPSYNQARESLLDGVLHHNHTLRLASLKLHIVYQREPSSHIPSETLLNDLIAAESVPLTLAGVRERVLKTQKIVRVVTSKDDAIIASRWLISQLKVNLRPLWDASSTALGTLSGSYPDILWDIFKNEFQATAGTPSATDFEPFWRSEVASGSVSSPWTDEERTWRDGQASKFHQTWQTIQNARVKAVVCQRCVSVQTKNEKLDTANVNGQLVHMLSACPSVLHRHAGTILPWFLEFASLPSPSRTSLVAWLQCLSSLKLKSFDHSSPTLRLAVGQFLTLISFPDVSVQRPALDCMLNAVRDEKTRTLLGMEGISDQHAALLKNLLDDKAWREELVNYANKLDISGQQLQPGLAQLVVRELYGIMRDRRRAGGKGRNTEIRRSCLRLVENISSISELDLLVKLMVSPFSPEGTDITLGEFDSKPLPPTVTERQQLGFLTLLEDLLAICGKSLLDSGSLQWRFLFESVVQITAQAQTNCSRPIGHLAEDPKDEESGDEEEVAPANDGALGRSVRQSRAIRQQGIRRIADFMKLPVEVDLSPYLPSMFKLVISPRLTPTFASESSQSPSALLDLFVTWSEREWQRKFLFTYNQDVFPTVVSCLGIQGVKPAVVSRIFDLIENLTIRMDEKEAELFFDAFLRQNVRTLLSCFGELLKQKSVTREGSGSLGLRLIALLSYITRLTSDVESTRPLLRLVVPLLAKSDAAVSEKTKTSILSLSQILLEKNGEGIEAGVAEALFLSMSEMFQSLRSQGARQSLVLAFQSLSGAGAADPRVAELLASLNSLSSKRRSEPDFERRLQAFAQMNDSQYTGFDARSWRPILHNMFHFVQDTEELSIRINAGSSLKRFIDQFSTQTDDPSFLPIYNKVFYKGLKNGLRTRSEPVRVELLGVLQHAVRRCTSIKVLQELSPLLAGGDEEADFFNNVHHIQVHRRVRALRRFSEICDKGGIRSGILADIFVPLVGTSLTGEKTIDHTVVNEAITCLGRMARQLAWSSYYGLVQHYTRLAKAKTGDERVQIRALVAVLDNFHFVIEDKAVEDVLSDDEEDPAVDKPAPGASTGRIADAVVSKLLPSLLNHLENRDEAEENVRVPVSIGIVKIALHLPEETRRAQIVKLFTVLAQILRSHSQDTRDLVRETLCRIMITLGGSSLALLVKELRAALMRGTHLLVLAHVVHTILVHITTPGNVENVEPLDDAAEDIAHIAADVVFGQPAQDVNAEGYKVKGKEVKGSAHRGLETFMLLSQHVNPQQLSVVLSPLRAVLHESISSKILVVVDELLKKIAVGINANGRLTSMDLITLCHTLISGNSRFVSRETAPAKPSRKRRLDSDGEIVRTTQKDKGIDGHFATNSFRFVALGLELLGTALRRSRFDVSDEETKTRLESAMSVLGNSLYVKETQVLIPALRATNSFIKLPLPGLTNAVPVIVRQVIELIRTSGSSESELAQTALRTLAVIIRESEYASINDKDLRFLLEFITPDLEEPNRQSSVFILLRGVVSRKFVVPEVYDLMDKVAGIMVTNQSPQTRESCRGLLLQFYLDYPQGKARWKKQMTFLAKNLSYPHESGRMSVMELLSAVFGKVDDKLLNEDTDMFFMALMLSLANEDSTKCKEMAATLLKSLFQRQQEGRVAELLKHVEAWCTNGEPQLLKAVAFQAYGITFDVLGERSHAHVDSFLESTASALENSVEVLDDDSVQADETVQWQVTYHALTALEKAMKSCRPFPWRKLPREIVVKLLLFPHAWVRKAACRVLGTMFAEAATSQDGLQFDTTTLINIADQLSHQLKSRNCDSPLGLQIVKNLFYIGKKFEATSQEQPAVEEDGDDDSEDEGEVDESDEKRMENPLAWLFSKISYQARSVYIGRSNRSGKIGDNWDVQLSSAMRWFAAMSNHMQPEMVEKYLVHMLSIVYRIVDDESIRDSKMVEVKNLAQELQDLIQKKVGASKFATVYNEIRQGIQARRVERKNARVVQRVQNPELAAKRQAQRYLVKKDSKKRRDREFADSKIRNNPVKRRRT